MKTFHRHGVHPPRFWWSFPWHLTRSIFARGGVIPGASRDSDLVPAILSRGGQVVSREQAEAMGLTADAKRLPPEATE